MTDKELQPWNCIDGEMTTSILQQQLKLKCVPLGCNWNVLALQKSLLAARVSFV